MKTANKITPQDIQIVIPMSGEGSRFVRAGYDHIKPLIPVNGKPIIDYATRIFAGARDFLYLIRAEHATTTDVLAQLTAIKPAANVQSVHGSKQGPVYAVSQAYAHIDDARPVIVSYCDFYQHWDFAEFVKYVDETQCDGAIPCYKGFHPHLLHEDNYYASCRVGGDNRVLEIREKYSFTENKQDSPQSPGIYYFKSGAIMKQYFDFLMANGPEINGEFYASLVYPQMIHDGLDIRVYDAVPHFCQWGTPQDFEEFQYWNAVFNHKADSSASPLVDQLILPMAGAGSRFEKAGYTTPKPLISVNEKPMVVCAIKDLPACKKTILIHQSKHIDADTLNAAISPYVENVSFINVDQLTHGQASTCLLARAHLDPQKSVLIGACDNGMIYDQSKFSKATEGSDCLVFTFRNNPTVVHKPQQYGWCDLDDTGMIKRMSVKKAISNNPIKDHAVVGAFWFKQSDIFTRAADKMIAENRRINNEFYVDELINDVIDLGYTARVFEIDNYICWGTPDDLKTYQYWQTFWKAENNV